MYSSPAPKRVSGQRIPKQASGTAGSRSGNSYWDLDSDSELRFPCVTIIRFSASKEILSSFPLVPFGGLKEDKKYHPRANNVISGNSRESSWFMGSSKNWLVAQLSGERLPRRHKALGFIPSNTELNNNNNSNNHDNSNNNSNDDDLPGECKIKPHFSTPIQWPR